jgi:FG-GAP-like repeat
MNKIRTVVLTLIAMTAILAVGPAQTQQSVHQYSYPPLSAPRWQYYQQHPEEFQQLLRSLPPPSNAIVPGRQLAPGQVPAGGTWTSLTYPAGVALMNPVLLTDGTVIAIQTCTSNWYKFTPDITGSYINGSWSPIASLPSNYGPRFFGSGVLPDGRVIIEGGEYNNPNCNGARTTKGAIYDPVANMWTPVNPPAGWSTISDAAGIVLADGTYMQTSCCDSPPHAALLNPNTLTWTNTGSGKFDVYDEESMALLPDGTVLTVDAYVFTGTCGTNSERYNPATGTWSTAGSTIAQQSDCIGNRSFEVGPLVLRPDGTVVSFPGLTTGTGQTAIYNTSTNTWSLGPSMPSILGTPYTMADAPAAVLPNGNVLLAMSPSNWPASNTFPPPTHYWELNISDNTFTQVADKADFASFNSFQQHFLVLPTGQVMASTIDGATVQIYTPTDTSFQPSWRPVAQTIPSTLRAGGTYALSGMQLSGLTEGAYYGDDTNASTNFPLVRIEFGNGYKYYARTFHHSTRSVAPNTSGSTNFKVPAGIETGAATLYVVANGIPSAGTPVTITSGPGCVVLVESHDFNGDCNSDILWRNVNSGGVALWLMSSASILSSVGVGSVPVSDWTIVGQRDFNADGNSDILWRGSDGGIALWFMNAGTITSAVAVGALPISWSVAGTGDFNGDGISDILWRDSTGNVAFWFMNSNATVQSSPSIGNVPINWQIVGIGDFNGDGIQDILWREQTAGGIALWLMNSNGTIKSAIGLGSIPITDWTIVGTGDFDGDGVSDILWRNSGGGIAMWLMNNNGTIKSGVGLGSLSITDWTVAETGDFNGDGTSDILWRHSSGAVALWLMNGGSLASALGVGSLTSDWQIQSANAD